MMLSMVGRSSFISWRLAPSMARPMGTPCPSVSKLRLTPALARSVGLGPVFFPAQRRFGHRPVHAQPGPVDPFDLIVRHQPGRPELLEDPGLDPLLEAVMGRGRGTDAGGRQRLPLTTRP